MTMVQSPQAAAVPSSVEQLVQTSGLETKRSEAEKKALVEWAEKQFKKSRSDRLVFERQWYVNMAFFFGRHYVQWQNAQKGSFDRLWEPPVPEWRVRMVINKIRPIIRKELSKITKEKPEAFVIPASSDDDDLAAAQAGESIYEHISREIEFHKLTRRAQFWNVICGTGFMKDWYDPNKVGSDGVMGCIQAEPVTPFHFFVPDYAEEELENQEWVVHCISKPLGWVRNHPNFENAKSVLADAGAANGMIETKFLQALGMGSQTNKENVAVKELWIKPQVHKKYPKGLVLLWAGETYLWSGDYPYQHGEYPFTKYEHIPAGRFYGTSTIEDLIPLNKEYNRTRSQIIEAKNRMSKPQLIAPKGSVDVSKITSEPGLVIQYQPGFNPPTPLPLQNLPSYVTEELVRIQRDMDDISSQHEISQGSTPPGVTAATAISYLQEEDDTVLSFTIASLEEGAAKMGRHFLSHAQQFWSAQRTIKVVGDSGTWESFTFAGSDLRGNADLHVEAGSATPRSRAAKQAYITELGKLGWIPPDKALRYLGMAETGRMYEELQVDAKQAQRENLKMSRGVPTTVNEWDEHAVHIMEHNLFRKKQAFEKLPDEFKTAFQEHVQTHQMVLAGVMGQPTTPGDPSLQQFSQGQLLGPDGQPVGGGTPPQGMQGYQPQGG